MMLRRERDRRETERTAEKAHLPEIVSHLFSGPFELPFPRFSLEPGIEVAEKGDRVMVTADVPGMEMKDIKVRLDGDTLTIFGSRNAKREIRKRDYYFLENRSGVIQRAVRLPGDVEWRSRKMHATNGVLKIELTKRK